MNKYDEQILVIPRRSLFGPEDQATFQGVQAGPVLTQALQAIAREGRLARRGDMESDPTYKQPIPYLVVSRASACGMPEVFAYERLQGGGEARLHSKISVGVGGHMNRRLQAEDSLQTIRQEVERELEEELEVQGRPADCVPEIRGLLNTDEDEVGQVHVGLVCVLRLPTTAEVRVREHEALRGFWSTAEVLLSPKYRERLEGWSLLALEFLATRPI